MKTARWILTLLFTGTATGGITGCLTEDVPIGSDTDHLDGKIGSEPVDVVEGYGFCSMNIYAQFCVGGSGADGTWKSGDDAVPDGMMSDEDCYCFRACDRTSDCPVPDTGTTAPACTEVEGGFSTCVLPCGDGQTCPDGMTCRETLGAASGPVCMWHDDPDESIFMNPEACGQRTTREDCEAVLSDYPIEPTYECAWAKETVIERDDVACESPLVVERCIAVQREDGTDPLCAAGRNCEGARGGMFWQELGAGDISLVELERCDLRPHTWAATNYEGCDFATDPVTPSVCDCACSTP